MLTDLSLGRAHWTSSVVIPSDKVGRTHTLAIYATRSLTDIIGKDYYANVETDFRPDGGVVTEQWAAFTNATCNNCHHTLGAHGGSRQDVKLCVTCHSPQTTDAETGRSTTAPTCPASWPARPTRSSATRIPSTIFRPLSSLRTSATAPRATRRAPPRATSG